MSIKKITLLMGLCVLFAGCTGQYGYDMQASGRPETATDKGARYLLGRGVAQNDAKAFTYFKQGTDDDDPFAENEVAYMYATGKGTSRDYGKALSYYQKAANHGLASAQYNLGLMYLHGLGIPPNKTLAMQWIQKSAAHGFEPARIALARS